VSHALSRRQFAFALAALMQVPVRQQAGQAADAQAEKRQRAAAMAELAATIHGELAMSGAGSWDRWVQRLAPLREKWKVVAAGTLKGRNEYVFNKNALDYLIDTDLEAGVKDTRPVESLAGFDGRMKKQGIDFVWVPIPCTEELYPENYVDAPPADLTVQPLMRRLLLSLLERDVEVIDLLRPLQAARAGYRLGLKRDDHWNNVELELAASVVAERLRRYGFAQAAASQPKRYTTKPNKISGDRGVSEMTQVLTSSGKMYEDVPDSPVLVIGDSNLQIYQYANENLTATGEHAGFTAHLARQLNLPISLEAQGGFRLAQLNRETEMFNKRRVVVFVGAAWMLSVYPWASTTSD